MLIALFIKKHYFKVLKYYLVPFFLYEHVFVQKHRNELGELVHTGEKVLHAVELCL